jgi:hypothetical protein
MMADAETSTHERLVEEIVRGVFTALDTSGDWSQRDAAEDTWKELEPDELLRQLERADDVVQGFLELMDGLYQAGIRNDVVYTALDDCRERVREASRQARREA